jgi:glycosyltransferase involved in cell wall biosynthesis
MTDQQPETVSLLLPAYNEAENLKAVISETAGVLEAAGFSYTVLVVDDGSTDETADVMAELSAANARVSTIRLRRNAGKSAALRVGLRHVQGDVVVLMDADGQDDANAIPTMIAHLRSGTDLVTGRRADRQDRFIKKHTSRVYNRATALLTGVPGRDFNSGLKVMRKEVADSLDMYGELHRYIPVLAHWSGFRVGEVDVVHRPRLAGKSKFGGNRFWRGFFDLLTVNFLVRYNARPFHLFGAIGLVLGLAGGGLLTWMLVLKIAGEGIGERPALIAGVLLVIVAVQILSVGLLAELIVHSRHARRDDAVIEH